MDFDTYSAINHGKHINTEYFRNRHGISPYGASGFIVKCKVYDKGTRVENLRASVAYAIVRKIIKRENERR